ncbi:urease accessory protein UreD [Consotaella aegiceratis]|uniref:urease accessory protein UreD n=1 Tax=Consotaella aegiceratis TaxID=3097961 RepID=UPI002F3E4007
MTSSALKDPLAEPLQRARGTARAAVRLVGETTRIDRLYQAGCLKLRFPRLPQAAAEAVLINTSGGLTGGDRLNQAFEAAEGTSLAITTQACERVYRAAADRAEVATTASVASNASLAWLPQETILFDGGRLARKLEVHCAGSSRLLLVESIILGRETMGEVVRSGLIADRWRITRDGRLVFADDLRLEGDIASLAARGATLAGARAFATVLYQDDGGAERLDEIRAVVGEAGAASAFSGLIVVRLTAASGFRLRKRLMPLLSTLAKDALPRVWSS